MFFTQLCSLLPAIPLALNDLQINQNMKSDSTPLLCRTQSACQKVQWWQRGFKESCLNILLPVNIRFSTNTAPSTQSLFKWGRKGCPVRRETLRKSNCILKQPGKTKDGKVASRQFSALLPQAIIKLIRSKPDLVVACITDCQRTVSAEIDTNNCSSMVFSGANKILMVCNSASRHSTAGRTSKTSENILQIANNLTLALEI